MNRTLACILVFLPMAAQAAPPHVVAAENIYADIVKQIGGPDVPVTAIMDNPEQDPHLFEASPSVARGLSTAGLVIYNGADYDPWMRSLLTATGGANRRVIDVADLMHVGTGANPHLWYDPRTMPVVARAIAQALSASDPANASGYAKRLAGFETALAALNSRIMAMRAKYHGQPITGTEPVFGLMANALGLVDRNQAFQRAIMNDTEPSASDVAAMEADLRGHKVRALMRNAQTDDDTTRRLAGIASKAGVPVVPVTELLPLGLSYQAWMSRTLDALEPALAAPR